ncbi:hypothetical protein SAMN05444161_9185 [Rhizobiales bacterium GAS191]|nr:hypothetical protein SAMN05444161_9185 [Rhizobiales bacterium GAS191]
MAVSHMPHDDGLGGLTLDDEFVGHQRAKIPVNAFGGHFPMRGRH